MDELILVELSTNSHCARISRRPMAVLYEWWLLFITGVESCFSGALRQFSRHFQSFLGI